MNLVTFAIYPYRTCHFSCLLFLPVGVPSVVVSDFRDVPTAGVGP